MHLRCTRRETVEVHSSRLAASYCNMCIQHCHAVPRYRHLSWLTLTNGSVSDDTRCPWGAVMVQCAARCGAISLGRRALAFHSGRWDEARSRDWKIGHMCSPEPQNLILPRTSRKFETAICAVHLHLGCSSGRLTIGPLLCARFARPHCIDVDQHTSQPLRSPCHRRYGLKPSHRACKVL